MKKKKPIKKIEKKIEKRIETQIEERFEKDRERIEKFKREHKRILWFTSTVVLHIKMFLKKNTEDNINALSGQSTFFLILSLVPLLMLIISLMALFGGKPNTAAMDEVAKQSGSVVNSTSSIDDALLLGFFRRFIIEAYEHASSGVIIITALTALWSAGKGLYIVTDGISRIYRIPQKHMWLTRRVFAMGYTVVLLLMMAVSMGLVILNAVIDNYLEQAIHKLPLSTEILIAMRYVIVTVIIALFLTVALKLYLKGKVDDDRYVRFRVLLPGMAFTAIAWDLLSWGVSVYTTYFSSSMYGSLSTVFIVMMWFYFLMLLLLYGVQIDYVYREAFYRFGMRKAIRAVKEKLSQNKQKKKAV